MRLLLPALFLLLSTAGPAGAQDLGRTLSEVGSAYARAYVRPLSDALGANLNTGIFQAAHFGSARSGLDLYLGVKAFGMLVPSSDRTFDLTYTGSARLEVPVGAETVEVSLPATLTVHGAPTVFGGTAPGTATVVVRHDTTFSYLGVLLPVSIDTTFTAPTISGLVSTGVAPLLVPQAGIGTLFGTSLMVRWLPHFSMEDVGTLRFFGMGLRHGLSPYVPSLPFGLAVQAAWQRVALDDAAGARVVQLSTLAANVEVSKRFGVLTLYGGLQAEESWVDVRYTQEVPQNPFDPALTSIPIHFSLPGINAARGVLGAALKAGPLLATATFNAGRRTVISAGLGLAF